MQKTNSSGIGARPEPGTFQPGGLPGPNHPPAKATAARQNVPTVSTRRRQRETPAESTDTAEGPAPKRIRLDAQAGKPEFTPVNSTAAPQENAPLCLAIPVTQFVDEGKFELLRVRLLAGQVDPRLKAQLLQEAASKGKLRFFNLLLEFGALAEYRKFHQELIANRKCTLFQCAVIGQNRLLLDRINEVDTQAAERPDSELKDALKIAAFKGCLKIVERLCDAADYKRIKWTPKDMSDFFAAAAQLQDDGYLHYSKDYPIIALLVRRYPNSVNPRVYSKALYTAVKSLNWEAASLFLGVYCADPNTRDSNGLTVLMVSAASGKLDTYNLLRFHGALAHAVDDAGNSVLFHAVLGGNQEIVVDLVQRCRVDANVRNKDGLSVSDWARQQQNQSSCIARIIRYGSDALDTEL